LCVMPQHPRNRRFACPVACEATKRDNYDLHLARCTVGGQDIAEWLASNDWAVPFRRCKREVVRNAAERAKSKRLGMWNGLFQMPWERREQH
jgi:endonuclease YncB( thermonuclease family)